MQFPFIVGFPKESDASVKETVRVALKLNSMSSNFQTPVFYFKPYPGTKITDEVIKEGYQLPKTVHEWSDFDFVGSSGPWVSSEKYNFFEKFKFYSKIAYSNQKLLYKPLQLLAKARCKNGFYKFPIEKKLADILFKKQQLA